MFGFSGKSWARLFRDGSWVLAGQVLTVVAGLVGVRVLTELASPAVFGETALWLGVVTLARNFFVIPVSMFQVRYHPEYKQRGRLDHFLDRTAVFTNRGSIATTAAGTVAYFGWVLVTGESIRPTLLIALLVMSRTDAYRTYYQNILNAERRQQGLALWTAVEAWAVVLCSAAALLFASTTEYYLIGTAAAWSATLLVFRPARTAGEGVPPVGDPAMSIRQELIAYGLPFVPLALFSWLLHFANRYVLGLQGPEAVGLFTAAFTLASKPAVMASSLVATVARPILFDAESGGRKAYAARIFTLWFAGVLASGTLICLALYVLSPWIVRWFLAPEFRPGAPAVILWVSIGYALYTLVNVVENRIMSFGRSVHLILPVMIGAVLVLVLNWAWIPAHGSLGAAWAAAGGFGGQLVATFVSMLRSRPGNTAARSEGLECPPG